MGSYLRFLLLSAVLIAVASAYTVEERDVEVFIPSLRQVGTIPPPRHYNAPVNPKAGGPDDFETLPYRYGFRLENTFDVVSGDAQYYRLCPLVPEFLDDDYELHVQVTSKTLCTGCNDNAQFLSLRVYTTAGLVDDGGILVKTNTPGSNCGGTSHISFNVKDLKASTPDGNVWIQVNYFSGTFDYALHFWKGSVLNWGGQTCTYPATASDVFSPCLSSFNNIFDCDNGIYEPTKEQCDLAIAEIGCTAECICAAPFRPDTLGGCTTCGNGLLELPFSEVCDTGLDPHCDVTCKKCVDGFVLDPNGKCSTCGNGVKEVGESCDAALSALCSDVTCTCTEGCVGDGNGGCTLCGNGDVDPGEYCDAADPGCNADCTACAAGRVSLPREGTDDHNRCSLCGNGVVDDGEVCDSFDFNCNDACDGCTRYHSPNAQGVCSRCGNGLLDKGEVCDSFRPGCKADCSGCQRGLVALVAGNSLGECTHCGNGVLEDDEVCDTALDPLSCASDCSSCHYPFVSVKRRCVTCGNGVRDRTVIGGKDEVCDAAQPGCRADCSACEDGYVPAVDAAGSCIATCENCCASLPKETASSTNGAGSSAASVFLAACVLIVMVVFN